MSRPTSLTGWWLRLLNTRARGDMRLLAQLANNVSTKTVSRWGSGEIKLPCKEHRVALRKLAGEGLLNAPDCPKYLRKTPKPKV